MKITANEYSFATTCHCSSFACPNCREGIIMKGTKALWNRHCRAVFCRPLSNGSRLQRPHWCNVSFIPSLCYQSANGVLWVSKICLPVTISHPRALWIIHYLICRNRLGEIMREHIICYLFHIQSLSCTISFQ